MKPPVTQLVNEFHAYKKSFIETFNDFAKSAKAEGSYTKERKAQIEDALEWIETEDAWASFIKTDYPDDDDDDDDAM